MAGMCMSIVLRGGYQHSSVVVSCAVWLYLERANVTVVSKSGIFDGKSTSLDPSQLAKLTIPRR